MIVRDLTEIVRSLGSHYDSLLKDAYQAQCDCEEFIDQDVNECPYCGEPVVWLHSRAWRDRYGDPQKAISKLNQVKPEDELGERLCNVAGVAAFRNKAEAIRWRRAVKWLSKDEIERIIAYCNKKKGIGGRGLIAYVLNVTDSKIDKRPRQEKPRQRPEGHMIRRTRDGPK